MGTTGSTMGSTGTTGSTMGSNTAPSGSTYGTSGSTMGSNTAPSGSTYGTTGSTMGSNTNMSSDNIRQLQQALNDNGEQVNIDGVMGPQTERALRDYQQKNGLQASGMLDEQTRQKLNIRG
jgi:peptidoglycan hydrolase-like protein with peptidoglycan-binding domain